MDAAVKFTGFIDRNPHHDLLEPPKVRTSSMNWGDYKRDVSSFFGSFGSGLGVVRKARDRGPDFTIKAGTLVPVKLSSGLDISRMTAPTVASPVVPTSASAQVPAPVLNRSLCHRTEYRATDSAQQLRRSAGFASRFTRSFLNLNQKKQQQGCCFF